MFPQPEKSAHWLKSKLSEFGFRDGEHSGNNIPGETTLPRKRAKRKNRAGKNVGADGENIWKTAERVNIAEGA